MQKVSSSGPDQAYFKALSTESSFPIGLIGAVRNPLRSPLPVFLNACLIVSILRSPVPRCGDDSWKDGETLVGGDEPSGADTGDLIGEGDRGTDIVGWLVTLVESRRESG